MVLAMEPELNLIQQFPMSLELNRCGWCPAENAGSGRVELVKRMWKHEAEPDACHSVLRSVY